MEKIWIGKEKKDTKIIILKDDMIYFGNPKDSELEDLLSNFKYQTGPINLFSLPISYISQIRMNEKSDEIDIFHKGKAHDQLIIVDEIKKKELFESLKNIRPSVNYTVNKQTFFQASKKPLIAFVIVSLLYTLTLFYISEMSNGVYYEVVGTPGLLSIVLGLAYLGYLKVALIFVPLMLIALIIIIKKMNKLTVFHILSYK